MIGKCLTFSSTILVFTWANAFQDPRLDLGGWYWIAIKQDLVSCILSLALRSTSGNVVWCQRRDLVAARNYD